MVRGIQIIVTDILIEKVSGLPAKGLLWVGKRLKLHDTIEAFRDEGQELIKKGKGIWPSSLGDPWGELAQIFQNCITCDGHKYVVRPRQLKLLAVSKQKCSVNLPALLNSLLHDTTERLRQSQHIETVVSHHFLIRLIVSCNLS